MNEVWLYSAQRGGPLLVQLAIADFISKPDELERTAYPSNQALAKKARMTPRHVNRALNTLTKARELSIERGAGPHGTNLYRVTNYQMTSCQGDILSGDKSGQEGVTFLSPKVPVSKSLILSEPLMNRTNDASASRKRKPDLEAWFDGEFKPAYPRPVQEKTAKAQLRELKPDANERTAIMMRLEKWKSSDEWAKETGRYIPGMCKFFEDGWYKREPSAKRNIAPHLNGTAVPTAEEILERDRAKAAQV
jgi:hypothetical protein